MSKPGRNDLCPCGSGKKYKKCCGSNNVVAFDSSLYTNELDKIQEQLIDFAFGQFETELFEMVQENIEENFTAPNEDNIEIYTDQVISWGIFTVPIKGEQTLFDLFYKQKEKKIKYPAVKNALFSWNSSISSAFKVKFKEDYVELENLSTGERYPTTYKENLEYDEGNIVIGTLVPYAHTYEFFISFLQIPGNEVVTTTFRRILALDDSFPKFVAELIELGNTPIVDIHDYEWDDLDYMIVAQNFLRHARNKGYDEQLIDRTVDFWSDYCKINYPIVRKYEAHAAALDYFSQRTFLPFTDVTQAELAEEYGTSPGTISNHYKKLANDFDLYSEMQENVSTNPTASTEKHLRDLMNMLDEQDFESEEDMEAFLEVAMQLNDFPTSENPRDIAQDLLFDARESSGNMRQKLIREALEIYPLSPDAYVLLAEDERDMDLRMELLEKAIDVGEMDLGEDFFKENEGHFWGLIETRPYMRAKHFYATSLENFGFSEEALQEYMHLLTLNPNDNQGIRYLLLRLFIEVEDYEAALALTEEYDEATAAITFSKALCHFEENGLTEESVQLLREADAANPYVMDYLKGRKDIPIEQTDYIGLGDETEAVAYVQENIHLWVGKEEFLQTI